MLHFIKRQKIESVSEVPGDARERLREEMVQTPSIYRLLGGRPRLELSLTHSSEDIRTVLEQMLAKRRRIDILIIDWFRSYKKTIKKMRLRLLHIQHLHSHPWRDDQLTAYADRSKERTIHEMTVRIFSKAFVR